MGKETPLTISQNDIVDNIARNVWEQRQAYRNAGAREGLQDAGVPNEMNLKDMLDREQVDGSIRAYIKDMPALANSVSVFPVFSDVSVKQEARTVVYNAIVKDARFQSVLPNNSELPEPSRLQGEALKARLEEEKKRNQQEQALNKRAEEALKQGGVQESTLFKYFLTACRKKQELWQDMMSPMPTQNTQWVIPLHIGGIHYTLVVVNFLMDKEASILYYDSFGHDMPKPLLEGITQYLKSKDVGMNRVTYQKESIHEQRGEGIECGVFVFYNAIRLLSQLKGIENPLKEWIKQGSSAFSYSYKTVFAIYRVMMADLLKKEGQNITIHPSLADRAKQTEEPPQEKHNHSFYDDEPQEIDLSGVPAICLTFVGGLALAAFSSNPFLIFIAGGMVTSSSIFGWKVFTEYFDLNEDDERMAHELNQYDFDPKTRHHFDYTIAPTFIPSKGKLPGEKPTPSAPTVQPAASTDANNVSNKKATTPTNGCL